LTVLPRWLYVKQLFCGFFVLGVAVAGVAGAVVVVTVVVEVVGGVVVSVVVAASDVEAVADVSVVFEEPPHAASSAIASTSFMPASY
jgi:hypothetical protein